MWKFPNYDVRDQQNRPAWWCWLIRLKHNHLVLAGHKPTYHENVIGIGHIATDSKEFQQIIELTFSIVTYESALLFNQVNWNRTIAYHVYLRIQSLANERVGCSIPPLRVLWPKNDIMLIYRNSNRYQCSVFVVSLIVICRRRITKDRWDGMWYRSWVHMAEP